MNRSEPAGKRTVLRFCKRRLISKKDDGVVHECVKQLLEINVGHAEQIRTLDFGAKGRRQWLDGKAHEGFLPEMTWLIERLISIGRGQSAHQDGAFW